ncbi:GNAT family N-acetyltransferase [Raineyella fluvialis]|uniref:Uncharacterized protein n=1 Tax=Raineyella fluvialis TaxID=2662261 RepID=A0A5Q2F7Q0_9ACTN|nr:hypothetical protein [Raineyella fluvialis]QGF22859.1 hypothetical protein Rai3103_03320 [Raineyella fluvialis]
MSDLRVRFNPDRSRWEALLDGDEVGHLDYQVKCGIVEMSGSPSEGTANADPESEDVLASLVRAGLQQAKEDGLTVVATSPEVDEFLATHPDAVSGSD